MLWPHHLHPYLPPRAFKATDGQPLSPTGCAGIPAPHGPQRHKTRDRHKKRGRQDEGLSERPPVPQHSGYRGLRRVPARDARGSRLADDGCRGQPRRQAPQKRTAPGRTPGCRRAAVAPGLDPRRKERRRGRHEKARRPTASLTSAARRSWRCCRARFRLPGPPLHRKRRSPARRLPRPHCPPTPGRRRAPPERARMPRRRSGTRGSDVTPDVHVGRRSLPCGLGMAALVPRDVAGRKGGRKCRRDGCPGPGGRIPSPSWAEPRGLLSQSLARPWFAVAVAAQALYGPAQRCPLWRRNAVAVEEQLDCAGRAVPRSCGD